MFMTRLAQCYNLAMSPKLSTVNPYLRDPAVRERTVFKSVASSSAIEGIHAPFKQVARTSDEPHPHKARLIRKKS